MSLFIESKILFFLLIREPAPIPPSLPEISIFSTLFEKNVYLLEPFLILRRKKQTRKQSQHLTVTVVANLPSGTVSPL